MTYVYIPFDTVEDLITHFQNMDISDINPLSNDSTANFVLITPHFYHGKYGGLMYNSILNQYEKTEYIVDAIDEDISLVWWWYSYRRHTIGDTDALSVGERKAVTPTIFKQLLLNPLRKPAVGKSSYYGDKAWSIKARSSLYSDSV